MVRDALFVYVRQRLAQLVDDVLRDVLTQTLVSQDVVEEIAALDKFEDEVYASNQISIKIGKEGREGGREQRTDAAVGVPEDLTQLADIGMSEVLHDVNLAGRGLGGSLPCAFGLVIR
jgi:hypothetical protein